MDLSIDRDIQDLEEMENVAQDMAKFSNKLMNDIIAYSNNQQEDLMQLKESIQELADVHNDAVIFKETIKEKREELQSMDANAETIEKAFEEALKLMQIECGTSPLFDDVLEALEEVCNKNNSRENSDEEEIFITENTASFKDPLTKRVIQDPVKSRMCQHYYERTSILMYLRTFKKCPYAGCKMQLRKIDLVDDLELKAKLTALQS